MDRRAFLLSPVALLADRARAAEDYPPVTPGHALQFPRDHGAHPAFRTEWWYVTGWLAGDGGRELGFQITFFRSRPRVAEGNPSAFAPRQLVFAHAALADPRAGRLVHDQRAARAGFGLADAREGDTDVWVDDWSLRHVPDGYSARVPARDFGLELAFRPTQPILLQGDRGYSRKGPLAAQSSYSYSRPQLAVEGTIPRGARTERVMGRAWLDHEWSSEYMAPQAVGWDWVGLNLADGGALMAFRMRGRETEVFWGAGTLRSADGRVRTFAPDEVRFEPRRRWKSPRTEVEYPVAMRVRAGDLDLDLDPLMDDQELDSRGSTGTIYWEGAVRAKVGVRVIGAGYLELTGYWKPLKL
ncbi:MAG TPA: carotenoid 1,2-hydratase [Burkholderiales bacterium]|nr:carotenoid 1,2-hydratase [Burkholderiales bacterium]